jgi:hypothetical protein
VLGEGGIIVESDGLAQRGFDPSEHRQHDRNGLGGSLSGEPNRKRHARGFDRAPKSPETAPRYKDRVVAAGVEDAARHLIFGPEFPDASTRRFDGDCIRHHPFFICLILLVLLRRKAMTMEVSRIAKPTMRPRARLAFGEKATTGSN